MLIIAIVDDDKALCEATAALLQSFEYQTLTYGSAEAFLKSARLRDTSCVVVDLHMPNVSGIDLQNRLLAQGFRIPVILVTANPNDTARTRATKNGAVCFLIKPYKPDELIECIRKALDEIRETTS
jgi:FixJ family two-component response regulator